MQHTFCTNLFVAEIPSLPYPDKVLTLQRFLQVFPERVDADYSITALKLNSL